MMMWLSVKNKAVVGAMFIFSLVASIAFGQSEKKPIEVAVGSNTAFAADLYHQLKGTKDNLFLSPYSISTALTMLSAGARKNTEKQIMDTLKFTLPQELVLPAFAQLQKLWKIAGSPETLIALAPGSFAHAPSRCCMSPEFTLPPAGGGRSAAAPQGGDVVVPRKLIK